MIEIRDDVVPLGMDFEFPEIAWMGWIVAKGTPGISLQNLPEKLILLRTQECDVNPSSTAGNHAIAIVTSRLYSLTVARLYGADGIVLVEGPSGNSKELYREYVR